MKGAGIVRAAVLGLALASIFTIGVRIVAGQRTVPGKGASATPRDGTVERLAQGQPGRSEPQPERQARMPNVGPGDYVFTVEHEGANRQYRVHVPRGYNAEKPTALLVSLHGGGANMDYQAADENYGQVTKADREGFIVAFPNGFSRLPGGKLATWNAGNCCGPARDRNVDDVGFIRRMLEDLSGRLNVDRQKIFATGMSNGAMMAHRLACEMSDTFRAIAAVAGTDNTRRCEPTQPVGILQIHARNDDHVPFEGGRGPKSLGAAVTDFTSVPESVSRWVRRNGCNATPRRVLEKPGAYCDRFSPCRGGAEVQLCVTDTGTHSWPGASRSRSAEPPSTAISANDVMWDFFTRH